MLARHHCEKPTRIEHMLPYGPLLFHENTFRGQLFVDTHFMDTIRQHYVSWKFASWTHTPATFRHLAPPSSLSPCKSGVTQFFAAKIAGFCSTKCCMVCRWNECGKPFSETNCQSNVACWRNNLLVKCRSTDWFSPYPYQLQREQVTLLVVQLTARPEVPLERTSKKLQ